MASDDYDEEFDYDDGYSFDPELEVEYFLFDGSVARLWYDSETGHYVDGEILGDDVDWEACPAGDVLSEGQKVGYAEAANRANALGAAL